MSTGTPLAGHFAPGTLPFRDGHVGIVELGEGPTVGYLHGMLGNPGVHAVLEELAAVGHRVVAPSLPGFTGSSEPDGLRNLHDWVVATSEVVDVAGLAGAPLVASSVGAMLALELAAVRPEAFGPMVLVAPFGLWDDSDPVADPFGTTLSVQRAMLTEDTEASAAFFDDPTDLPADMVVEHGVHRYLTRTAAAQLIWPLPEWGLAERLHRVTNPVTLVHGAKDRIIPASYLERWAEALPNVASTHLLDDAGHQADFDQPAAVAQIATAALA
ncbi:alpha/beta hydrolase [Candidatus Poriferisodalis multihospitum]|uniref:alpha/beta fold hydrolase n=1 Tax=Candidatus Poriferisodalis multihospitum TaxID=2983191 RepID=UPI002B26446A|nr:alpha/beta hydrolase [Candidatus Poriferisodalis multihospitum]